MREPSNPESSKASKADSQYNKSEQIYLGKDEILSLPKSLRATKGCVVLIENLETSQGGLGIEAGIYLANA